VKGNVTYNGHTLDEFVPQKKSVYISQQDLHVAEMTVRETLDFSARCQGIGTRYGKHTFSSLDLRIIPRDSLPKHPTEELIVH
jgi:ABC-type multidrug transport system ATPase subunit